MIDEPVTNQVNGGGPLTHVFVPTNGFRARYSIRVALAAISSTRIMLVALGVTVAVSVYAAASAIARGADDWWLLPALELIMVGGFLAFASAYTYRLATKRALYVSGAPIRVSLDGNRMTLEREGKSETHSLSLPTKTDVRFGVATFSSSGGQFSVPVECLSHGMLRQLG